MTTDPGAGKGNYSMLYTADEAFRYVKQEDVQCVRLAFFDALGHRKTISILPGQLPRAVEAGIPLDAFPMDFPGEGLVLLPHLETLQILPWLHETKTAQIYCGICAENGVPLGLDSRNILHRAQREVRDMGLSVTFQAESTFYLLPGDARDTPVRRSYEGGYRDDPYAAQGESVRMEICRGLESMGISPLFACNGQGAAQHRISLSAGVPMETADRIMTLQAAVEAYARLNGLHGSFTPKPLMHQPCNNFCVRISLSGGKKWMEPFLAGIFTHIRDMTVFLCPTRPCYERLGELAGCWIRQVGEDILLYAPDQSANLYIAFALLLFAGMDGIRQGRSLPESGKIPILSKTLEEAVRFADISGFIEDVLPGEMLKRYKRAAGCP